ncbi:MAG: plasmid stabilization system protein [Phycisphaerales bacterium]|nr:plasmid stabilization system protein [Phycisphaerales bacterium]
MSVAARRHHDVRDDVIAVSNHIADDSIDAAARFPDAVEATIAGLRAFPGKGSLKHFNDPRLSGIRSYAVDGFPNHLILYGRDADGGITVLMVTQGSRQQEFILRRRV